MKKILALVFFTLLAMAGSALSAETLIGDGKSGNWQLLDNAGHRWNAKLALTTNGNGDVYTLGGLLAADNYIGDPTSGTHFLIDNGGKWWGLDVVYTTDGSGNVIPVPPAPVSSVFGMTGAVHLAARHSVYVDFNNGSDTGDGTIALPFRTLAHALSTITTATYTNQYVIEVIGGGQDTEAAITWKPNVSLKGTGQENTEIVNGISYTEAGSTTGAITMQDVRIDAHLTINNGNNGSIDLVLQSADVTGLDFNAGLATTNGEVYATGSRIYGASHIGLVQRSWIMASQINGIILFDNAAQVYISGTKMSAFSDGIAPNRGDPAVIQLGNDAYVTIVGETDHGNGQANYTVQQSGTINMTLRYDAISVPSSVTGTITKVLLTDGANIKNTPAGNIASTTVQTAINELDTEKQALLPWTTTGDLVYYSGGAQRLAAGSSGYTLKANGAGAAPSYDRPFRDPSRFLYIHEDWVAGGSSGSTGWTAFAAGTGATTSVDQTNTDSNHPGLLGLSFGTTSSGHMTMALGAPNVPNMTLAPYTKFETLIRLQFLSTATDEYQVRVGFGDATAGDFTNGVYIEYDRTASLNWRCKSSKAATRTTVDSGVAVAATTWVKLAMVYSGGVVTCFVNGTAIGTTIATNLPNTSANLFVPIVQYAKSAGTSAETLSLDYYDMDMEFTTPR